MEAIALQTADLSDAMERDARLTLAELRVDGGASRSAPLLQIQADLLGRPVVRPRVVETTALGAAALAGIGVGALDVAEFGAAWAAEVRVAPGWDGGRRAVEPDRQREGAVRAPAVDQRR